MDKITESDLKTFLKDMQILTQVNFDGEEKKRIFELWKEALEDLKLLEFIRAKKELLKEWKYAKFPKPADILSRVHRIEETPLTEFDKPRTKAQVARAMKARDEFFNKIHNTKEA